jgi:2-polyprenyl-6-methoxyphenol hydroxylase-like FAD-dependent oxidoreductase
LRKISLWISYGEILKENLTNNILVVGAGPIGSFMALCLVRYGLNVSIIDKIPSQTTFTKALTINSSTLKLFHGLRIVDKFLKQGKILTDAEAYFEGKLAVHLNKRYLETCYNYFLSIPQTLTEQILHDELKSHGVEIRYENELINLTQHSSHVEVQIKDNGTDVICKEKYEYVIGCDGAHSKTRDLVGLDFSRHDYDMYFVVADVFFENGDTIEKSSYFMNAEGDFVGTFLMRDDGCTRLAIKQNGCLPRNKPVFDKQFLQRWLDKVLVNKRLKIKEMTWSSAAQIITRTTACGNIDRVFIAGDAYHLFSPVGGHNMNTGFHDTMNLAWKLAFHINGYLDNKILDTYSCEREIAIQKLLEVTNLNTQIVMQKNTTHPKRKLFEAKFTNRKYFRSELPSEFAGYFADYSKAEGEAGKHVPYIDNLQVKLNVHSTYDIPILQKYVVFYNAKMRSDELVKNRFNRTSDIVIFVEVDGVKDKELMNKLKLKSDYACVVRPDGMICYHDEIDKLIPDMLYKVGW